MSYDVVGFIFLLVGTGLALLSLYKAVVTFANKFETGGWEWPHAWFVTICVPLVYDFFLSNSYNSYGISFEDFAMIAALLGFLSLIPLAFEYALSKVKTEDGETIIALIYIACLAIFVLWRLYDIIMVRENFWIMALPFAAFGVAAFFAVIDGISSTAHPPSNSIQPTPRNNPPQQIIDPIEDLSHIDPRTAFDVPPQRLDE